jgi:hypothetical protein
VSLAVAVAGGRDLDRYPGPGCDDARCGVEALLLLVEHVTNDLDRLAAVLPRRSRRVSPARR